MSTISRFWRQPNKSYRNMQIIFTLLWIQFIIPGLSYFFAPEMALQQFQQIGRLLGGGAYLVSEESIIWRVLASGNVVTLAFLCLLMSVNIRRFYALVPAFAVLKGYSAFGYLYVFLFENAYPVFLAVFFWDGLALVLVTTLGPMAFRAVGATPGPDDETLVPRLRFAEHR